MRSFRDYLLLFLKGMGIGAADVVPGVSGGTIAFISGIYEELIDTISRINIQTVSILFKEGIKSFWKAMNGNFLLAILGGVVVSILSLSKLISFLLENEPIATWSFFFGLVLASIPLVAQKVKNWTGSRYFAFAAGAIIAWLITGLPPVTEPGALWYLFISGMIAICAMILPGISGSFILILLGSYFTVLSALNNRDITVILVFIAGAITGILAFSKFLKFMFSRFHDITVATLSGFLLGSLNKIWPWKNVLEWFVKHPGEANEQKIPLVEENILPGTYTALTGEPSQLALAIIMAVVGIAIIFILEKVAGKKA